MRTHNRRPCLCAAPSAWRADFIHGRIEACPGARLEAWLRCFAHPSMVLRAGVHAQCIAFAPSTALCSRSSEMATGFVGIFIFLFFGLCIFGPKCIPTAACMELFLVPHSFFVFCSSRRGVSRCKLCSTAAKGL